MLIWRFRRKSIVSVCGHSLLYDTTSYLYRAVARNSGPPERILVWAPTPRQRSILHNFFLRPCVIIFSLCFYVSQDSNVCFHEYGQYCNFIMMHYHLTAFNLIWFAWGLSIYLFIGGFFLHHNRYTPGIPDCQDDHTTRADWCPIQYFSHYIDNKMFEDLAAFTNQREL